MTTRMTIPLDNRQHTPSAGQQTLPAVSRSEPEHSHRAPVPASVPTRQHLVSAQTLPALALHHIFSHLALSTQAQCAQVCRHWYNNLPSSRTELAQWLQEYRPFAAIHSSQLVAAYRTRSYPWLASHHSKLLPRLERQHQELLLLQERAASEARPELQHQAQLASRFLAGLIRHALHDQMTRTGKLNLQPVPIANPNIGRYRVEQCRWSPCGRWILLTNSNAAGNRHAVHLFGWDGERWQSYPAPLPPSAGPVIKVRFVSTPPDTLVSTQGADLWLWQKRPDEPSWHSRLLCHAHSSYPIALLVPMANGDIITLSNFQDTEPTATRDPGSMNPRNAEPMETQDTEAGLTRDTKPMATLMLFSHYLGDERGWTQAQPLFLPQSFSVSTENMRTLQLALATAGALAPDSSPASSQVHVWYLTKNEGRRTWCCSVSVLRPHVCRLENIVFSPDGQRLVALFSDGQLRLFALDTRHQLQEKMTLRLQVSPAPGGVHPYKLLLMDNQLIAATSPHQLLFWDEDQYGHWQAGATITTPPNRLTPPDDLLRTLFASSTGRLLVRLSRYQVTVWRRHAGNWQQVLQRTNTPASTMEPQADMRMDGDSVITVAEDPVASLFIHGPDPQGKFIRKAHLLTSGRWFLSRRSGQSPDGLSLLLVRTGGEPLFVQLTGPDKSRSPAT